MEWNYSDARAYRWVFGIVTVLMMAFLSGKNLLNPADPLWFTQWWGWAIVLAGAGFVTLFGRTIRVSAGADWLMDRKAIVKTYELVSVTMEKDWAEGEVHFQDREANRVGIGLGTLRTNEALWDLVYNGIRHSVAGGAQVNRMAVERLGLYDVLAIAEERRFDQQSE